MIVAREKHVKKKRKKTKSIVLRAEKLKNNSRTNFEQRKKRNDKEVQRIILNKSGLGEIDGKGQKTLGQKYSVPETNRDRKVLD